MDKKLINIASVFAYFIPLGLLTGPFLADTFISFISLIFLFISVKNKDFKYFNNKFFLLFFLFYLFLILRSLFSENILFSLEQTIFFFRFGIYAIAIWFIIVNNPKFISRFTIFLFLAFCIAIMDGYYQYFNNQNIFGLKVDGTRMSLLLSERSYLGGYIARIFPLVLGFIFLNYNFEKKTLIIFFILLILTDVLIFITGERTAFGLLLISTLFIIILISKYKKIRIITFFISLLIIVAITFIDPEIKNRNIDHTLSQVGITEDSSKTYYFSLDHHRYLITSWNMFLSNPLFGKGPNTYRIFCKDKKYYYDEKSCSTHPHNIYIQLLAETGIIGTLPIIILSFYLILNSIRHIYLYNFKGIILLSDFQVCLYACFLITLWPLIPSQNFFNNWISVLYFLPIGFYLYSTYED